MESAFLSVLLNKKHDVLADNTGELPEYMKIA